MKKAIKYYTLAAMIGLFLAITILGAINANVLLSVIFGILTLGFTIILIVFYVIDKSFNFFSKLDDEIRNNFWNT